CTEEANLLIGIGVIAAFHLIHSAGETRDRGRVVFYPIRAARAGANQHRLAATRQRSADNALRCRVAAKRQGQGLSCALLISCSVILPRLGGRKLTSRGSAAIWPSAAIR